MTATLPRWMTDTGPLPIFERPQQPRDAAGRFAELPPPPAPPVRREANGAVLIADNPDVPNRWRVRVDRAPSGRIRITYLEGPR